ncbi:MAG: sulfatase [Planctomycetes bacterium]|nr:sulfatase [Planctomycetota bacterium]
MWHLATRRGETDKPNILMFIIDTLRADHLGCYGYARRTSSTGTSISPTIDRLAREGILFENTVSQASYTTVSMASMFTGLYPCNNGVLNMNSVIQPPTLTERLKAAGYATFGISANPFLSKPFGFAKGFDEHVLRGPNTIGKNSGRTITTYPKIENPIVPAASFIRDCAGKGRPFFVFVHAMDVHGPYVPPWTFQKTLAEVPQAGNESTYRKKLETILAEERHKAWNEDPNAGDYWKNTVVPRAKRRALFQTQIKGLAQFQNDVVAGSVDVARAAADRIVTWYDAEITYVDSCIKELLNMLSKEKLERRLLTVIASDHGEEFLEHKGCGHAQTLFQEVISVPLILHSPALPGALRIRARVRNVDLFPTILEMAGGRYSGPSDGLSLAPLIQGKSQVNRPACSYLGTTKHHPHRHTRCIIDAAGRKLILAFDRRKSTTLAFDLNNDPQENNNILREASFPFDELTARLNDVENSDVRAETFEMDQKTIEQLKALGYLN